MTTSESALRSALSPGEVEELEKLIAEATDENLADDGRYFDGHFNDLTQCSHDETGRYCHAPDGKLVEFLWNHRHQFLALLRREEGAET